MHDLTQKTRKKEIIFEGQILRVRKDEAQMPDGQFVEREVVEHPGGVGIALENEDGKFFLVRQWRYAQEQETLEFPAGTAMREIVEETGYEGCDWKYLGSMMPTPAYDTEVIELYYARKGAFRGQHLDSDEDLDVAAYSLEELTDAVLAGKLRDAKTMYLTLLLRELKARGEI